MLNMNLQMFAHKKGVGSTKNGRDSESKRLGAKRADGQFVLAGNILYRQSIFMGKISELHDLIAHDLIFFCRVKTDLEEMLRIDPSDPASIDPVLSGKDTGTIK